VADGGSSGSFRDALLAVLGLRPPAGSVDRMRALEEELESLCSALRAAETRNRTLEWRLRQAQRLESLGRLAGGVAHDFNNLLSVIGSNVDLALEVLPEGHPVREHLADIGEAGSRGAALTRRLLAFARPRTEGEPRIVDLAALLPGLRRLLDRILGEGVELRVQVAPGLAPARVEPGQLEQVLLNLAANARDAMGRGAGPLEIRAAPCAQADLPTPPASPCAAWVRLTVRDDGAGMTEEVQARAFEPFYSTKGLGRGTGLGLATVQEIVRSHGGQISLRSAPGQGTTFDIFLPAEPEAAPVLGAAAGPDGLLGGTETLVLVEDDAAVRLVAHRILERLGYDVLAAHDGGEALELLRARPADLLLTDVVMPGLSGPELALAALDLRPSLRILYMSGYPQVLGQVGEVLGDGVELLAKPFTPDALARRVRQVLGGPRQAA